MSERAGSCLCGEVTYKVSSDPIAARICWCKDCQKLSANGTANILVLTDSITSTGKLSEFQKTADSGNIITRKFCPKCGTHVYANSSVRPQFTVIRAGTLSDPSSITPTMNIWNSSAPSWACLNASLEQVDKQPAHIERLKTPGSHNNTASAV
ncbi:MAG: hypothetical protein DID90_2727554314 [Candidatus Nitrotoga sp. LAW]|nr:MAG: hypothetical protein DID90_2727554314 [Candidatus Nitrotoga sp. LAW]